MSGDTPVAGGTWSAGTSTVSRRGYWKKVRLTSWRVNELPVTSPAGEPFRDQVTPTQVKVGSVFKLEEVPMRRSFAVRTMPLLAFSLLACFPDEPLAPNPPSMNSPSLKLSGSPGLRLVSQEIQVTSGSGDETNPTPGSDATSSLVAYSGQTSDGLGQIFYQRHNHMKLIAGPVPVSEGGTNDRLNDTHGDFIVYTAYLPRTALGEVKLYEMSSGISTVLSPLTEITEARVHNRLVAWVEGPLTESRIMLLNLDRVSHGERPLLLAGPEPSASSVDIGSRLVAWSEDNGNEANVRAYDFVSKAYHEVATTGRNETSPATSGPWVVWQASGPSKGETIIEAHNIDSGERRTIASNGAANVSPSIDGDFVTYESNVGGNFDVYLYRPLGWRDLPGHGAAVRPGAQRRIRRRGGICRRTRRRQRQRVRDRLQLRSAGCYAAGDNSSGGHYDDCRQLGWCGGELRGDRYRRHRHEPCGSGCAN
jgi:hypothetical protein